MSVKTNVQNFWRHFCQKQETIEQCLQNQEYETLSDILNELQDEVNRISGCSFFIEDSIEFLEMTFDPGPNKTCQYLASLLAQSAPKQVLKKWIVNDHLVALSQKAIEAQIKIKEQIYTLPDFHVFYTVNEQNQSFSCLVYCPGFGMIDNTENKKEMSMYLLELAIGQTYYEAYLQTIDFIDQPDSNMAFCNLIDFYDIISDVVEKNKWKQYKTPLDIYSVFQPREEAGHETLRKDMKFIFTTHPLLVEETLGNGQDVLLDLRSKDGDFGYMYYANPFDGKENALFRQELSKKLDEMMSSKNVGKVIGGAIGSSFSYIDWIVYDEIEFEQMKESIKKQFANKIELHYQSF